MLEGGAEGVRGDVLKVTELGMSGKNKAQAQAQAEGECWVEGGKRECWIGWVRGASESVLVMGS